MLLSRYCCCFEFLGRGLFAVYDVADGAGFFLGTKKFAIRLLVWLYTAHATYMQNF